MSVLTPTRHAWMMEIQKLINRKTELLRLMAPNSSNQMASLGGSGFKTEEDHLNIKGVDSSVCYYARALLICGNV